MTRPDYIEAVKVKLEEISPFDEPTSFIAASDSAANTVKPIISYIDNTLDEAAKNCLQALPLSLLHADIEHISSVGNSDGKITMEIDERGVGIFSIAQNTRLIRFRHSILLRDITAFITTEDSLYLLQQNPYTCGGIAKPVAVWSSNDGQIEIYSFPKELRNTTDETAILLGINIGKSVEVILSPVSEYIVLECAAMVADILNNTAAAQACRQEQQTKIASVLV